MPFTKKPLGSSPLVLFAVIIIGACLGLGVARATSNNLIVQVVPNSSTINENSELKATANMSVSSTGALVLKQGLSVDGGLSADSITSSSCIVTTGNVVFDGGFQVNNGSVLYGGLTTDGEYIDGGLLVGSGLTVGAGGAAVGKIYKCIGGALTTASVGACNNVAAACAGAVVGDRCILGSAADPGVTSLTTFISGAGTATIKECNWSAATSTIPAGTQTLTCFH